MFKFMLIVSALFQTMITTTVEILGNERGEVLTAEQIAAQEAKALAETQAAELKANSKKEALRDLSKELGINPFEPSELKAKFDEFNKWQTDQKSEQEVLQEQLNSYKTKETEWQSKQLEYASKLEALKLNIADENIEDAMKLAGGDPSKLADVIKKYPVFKSKTGITIGVNNNNEQRQPGDLTEEQKYMAANPKLYGKYLPK